MKKRILFLSIALVSLTAFSYAADAPSVSKSVMSSFYQQFTNAKDIKWQTQAQFVKAEFTVNDHVLFAYYDNNGELIAVTRFISANQLPVEILTSLKKVYTNGYWLSDLFEIESANGTDYYATLESADQIVILKSEGINGWQTFQKVQK